MKIITPIAISSAGTEVYGWSKIGEYKSYLAETAAPTDISMIPVIWKMKIFGEYISMNIKSF